MSLSTIRFVLALIRPAAGAFLNMALTVVVFAAFDMLLPLLFALVVDEVISRHRVTLVPALALVLLILLIGLQLLYVLRQMCWADLRAEFTSSLRERLYEQCLFVTARTLDRERTGDLARTIDLDVSSVTSFMHFLISHTVTSFAMFVVAVALSAAIEPRAVLLMLVAIPAAMIASHRIGGWARRYAQRLRDDQGMVSGWVHEMLAGLADIQRLGAESAATSRYVRWWPRVVYHTVRSEFNRLTADRVAELISMIVEAAFFVLGAYLIAGNELSVGGFVALVEFFVIARVAVNRLSWIMVDAQRYIVEIGRIEQLLAKEREPTSGSVTQLSHPGFEFQGVNFAYDRAQPVLREFSLSVRAEERVAIVGASGAGKSTVALLLLRLYEPAAGGILVGGKAIHTYDTRSLRQSIAFVPSEPVVFSDSLRTNLTFVAGEVSDEQVWSMLQIAGLSETVRQMPEGLDTRVGRGGQQLSGGERQRVGLVRALLRPHRILVVDEGFSAVDQETERQIHSYLLRQQRTTIIIAHRLSTVVGCDRIAVMDRGSVVEDGDHAGLMARNGTYRRLFELQAVEREE